MIERLYIDVVIVPFLSSKRLRNLIVMIDMGIVS